MLIVTNAVTLEAYKSPGNCIGWEEQSFPSSYRHNQSLCGLVDWALTEVQQRAWEPCSREGPSLRAQAELNLWHSDTSHFVRLVCFQWHCSFVCVCVYVFVLEQNTYQNIYSASKVRTRFAKWGHFCWSPQLQSTVWLFGIVRAWSWVMSMFPQRFKYKNNEEVFVSVCVCFVPSEASGAVKTVVSPQEWGKFAAEVCVFCITGEKLKHWFNMQLRSTHTSNHTNQSLSKRLGGFLLFWRCCNTSPIEYRPNKPSWVLFTETTACMQKHVCAHFPV